MAMTDRERLERLLTSGHTCVSILTYEAQEAMPIVRAAAAELGREVMEWSVVRGIRDSQASGGATVSDTDHPAAALFWLSTVNRSLIVVMFDLIGHLKEERTMRALRETLAAFERNGSQLILIDQATQLPPALRAFATPLELSLPNEKDLESLVRETL